MTLLSDPSAFRPPLGRIALVGAGPGAADLLTLRALRRIQAADVVFHDRLVDPDVLALIPARAGRVDVGKAVGANAWPQVRIGAAIVAAARRGLSVVRLKSGDPSVFGRAAEEIEAALAHGIPVEIVPGITAASAAAAASLRPLTERDRFDRVVCLTATALTGLPPERLADGLVPGTRLALYMGVHVAAQVETALLQAGVPGTAAVTVCERVSTPQQRIVTGRLQGLAALIASERVQNPAVILLDLPKPALVPCALPEARGAFA
jgi:uroporphyrin-III C-methyltransferase